MKNDHVWYASYGSNLNWNRFLLYLRGGTFGHSQKTYRGCTNHIPPLNDCGITIPFELYFSGQSRHWENKAVAFIKSQGDDAVSTLSRAYLITKQQFTEIFLQENNGKTYSFADPINFGETINRGFSLYGEENQFLYYGRILYLGHKDDHPMFTFTAKWPDKDIVFVEPGVEYLKIIIKGIKETFAYDQKRICDYLMDKKGIEYKIPKKALEQLIEQTFNIGAINV